MYTNIDTYTVYILVLKMRKRKIKEETKNGRIKTSTMILLVVVMEKTFYYDTLCARTCIYLCIGIENERVYLQVNV